MNGTDVETVYFDSNILIEALEQEGEAADLLRNLLFNILDMEGLSIVTSALTLGEVLVKPFRNVDRNWIISYFVIFDSGAVALKRIGGEAITEACLLRADNAALKHPGAIHLATAWSASESLFVTRDRQLANVTRGAACERFGSTWKAPIVCTPDAPEFAALLERHAA